MLTKTTKPTAKAKPKLVKSFAEIAPAAVQEDEKDALVEAIETYAEISVPFRELTRRRKWATTLMKRAVQFAKNRGIKTTIIEGRTVDIQVDYTTRMVLDQAALRRDLGPKLDKYFAPCEAIEFTVLHKRT